MVLVLPRGVHIKDDVAGVQIEYRRELPLQFNPNLDNRDQRDGAPFPIKGGSALASDT